MNILFLTQVTGFLKPFAWIMGVILDAIYKFVSLFGVHNIALCIILFTLVVKMLMLPLTIKQQKFTRLSSKMNPELQKIQERYKGKKDEESMRRQQAETSEVYAKYGTSPMGGCLPMLITLPIMIALYRVIYAIPAYVNELGSWYGAVADSIMNVSGHADMITSFISENAVKVTSDLSKYAVSSTEYRNSLIDILAKFSTNNWEAFFNTSGFSALSATCMTYVENIKSANNFFGLNILDTPNFKNFWSLLIPVFAVVSQMVQTKLSTAQQPQTQKKNEENPMAASMQSMNTIMPLMSGVFCLMFPIGVGIYWVASATFTALQTVFINKYLDKANIDEMIEKNVEKQNKKKEKLGVITHDQKAIDAANTATKTYENVEFDNTSYKKNNKRRAASGSDYKRSAVSYKASDILANANLLAARNLAEDNSNSEVFEAKTEEGTE